ncbi:hypothetical protein CW751_04025 [Brumimicrobium salinarum]|uniref:Thioredoxin domain-containing protein n=1 Tax=Brumimicrobium salinarum TaxID=2058658 RepID=A0A2I0R531_9FLAO|nr:TlpA disulfide reductase family protein [Brumimicrobium salinarum]PKR81702.1 hypothetical protein CW751_04025 [Brumimicrobium salinarum]
MTNQILILLYLFAFCNFFSIGQIHISGHITNAPDSGRFRIVFYNNHFEFKELTAVDLPLNNKGKYSARFEWEKPQEATLNVGDEYSDLFLSPGDSLHITANYEDFDATLQYKGKGEENNNYLAAQIQHFFDKRAYRHSKNQDPFEYLAYVDSIKNANIDFYYSFDTTLLTPGFKLHMQHYLNYRFIDPRWMFKVDFSQFDENGNPFYKKLPAKYYQFIWELDLNDQKAFDDSRYSNALQRYIYEAMQKEDLLDSLNLNEDLPFYAKRYYFIKSAFSGKILDFQLTKFMHHYIPTKYENKHWVALMKDYKSTCQNQDYLAFIDNKFKRIKQLTYGKKAPDFLLESLDGDTVSLTSFKGKVVFIDFWATWCSPCISAIPKMEVLVEQFKHEKEIIILFINVEDSKSKWKKYLEENEIKGLHLYANKQKSKELFEKFSFSGIPHYVLIGKDGKIIDANVEFNGALKKRIKALYSN